MGQTLSEPVTEKHTTTVVRGTKYWVGLSDMQGWRITMEDSHSVHLYLPPTSGKAKTSFTSSPSPNIPAQPAGSTVTNDDVDSDGNALICVFDGHGGSAVAQFAGTTLHSRLATLDAYKLGDYEAALTEVFLKTDEDLRADPSFFNDPSGCTAVVALVTKDGRIIVANAGDSRSVLGYQGQAKAMSNDHKPTNKDETARITAAGGFVEFGRVNGNLALSRAIGDFEFKQNYSLDPEAQIVTVNPEIITHTIDGEEEFLILACDGIWDCLSSQQVIDFTRRAIAKGDPLGKICEDMMVKCLATDSETGGIGCDNMTVLIVALLGGRTPEEWQNWVKRRVDNKFGYDTPESIPNVFGQAQSPNLGGISGAGLRLAGAGGLANIASILGASGITFKPSDDSDDEDDDLEMIVDGDTRQSGNGSAKGAEGKSEEVDGYSDNKALDNGTKPVDITNSLSSLRPETENWSSDSKHGFIELKDEDGDSAMESGDESDSTSTGPPTSTSAATSTPSHPISIAHPDEPTSSPIPPSFTSIGSPEVPTHQELQSLKGLHPEKTSAPQNQLETIPGGDESSGAAKVEGMMDTSESPLRL